jgi:Raf kinase inhibitor-like YbhB/YbcL family protein
MPPDARTDTSGSDATSDRPAMDAPPADAGSDAPRDTTTTDAPATDSTSPPDGTTDAPSGDGSAPDTGTDAPTTDGSSAMVLTSTAFAEGTTIPADHTCDTNATGGNVSPPLSWTPGPTGTLSYAIVFVDRTFNNFFHSAIYDIPASVNALPLNVEKTAAPANVPGAKQVRSYQTNVVGYNGPCPGPTPPPHTYEFTLYAVDVAALPGVTSTTSGKNLITTLQAHDLGTAILTGTASTKIR